jgi:5-aminopentanamidase
MRLAALQMRAARGDVAANVARIELAARDAAEAGATLLVTPELSVTGYGAGDAIRSLAEAPDGPTLRRLNRIASDTGVAIIAGFAERGGERIYNSAAYLGGAGEPVIYRKSHLFGDYERDLFTPSTPMTLLFDHQGMRCGMLICYDVEFPENVRRLAQAGAEAILVPTALPAGPSGQFITAHMIRTRAFESQVFVAYTDHCGVDPLFSYAGCSLISAPDGAVLAQAGEADEALLLADLEQSALTAAKAGYDYLEDRDAAAARTANA